MFEIDETLGRTGVHDCLYKIARNSNGINSLNKDLHLSLINCSTQKNTKKNLLPLLESV